MEARQLPLLPANMERQSEAFVDHRRFTPAGGVRPHQMLVDHFLSAWDGSASQHPPVQAPLGVGVSRDDPLAVYLDPSALLGQGDAEVAVVEEGGSLRLCPQVSRNVGELHEASASASAQPALHTE